MILQSCREGDTITIKYGGNTYVTDDSGMPCYGWFPPAPQPEPVPLNREQRRSLRFSKGKVQSARRR